jgi:carbon monoxide dehydrogenase subunit G
LIEISASKQVRAPVIEVWKLISDLNNEHEYWDALRDVRMIERKENEIEREAKIWRGPLGEAKSVQRLVADPTTKQTSLELTSGPVIGTRRISLTRSKNGNTTINVSWKIEMKRVPAFALGFVKDNMTEVTERALAKIAKRAASLETKTPKPLDKRSGD